MSATFRRFVALFLVAGVWSAGCASRVSIEPLTELPCDNAAGVLWAGPKGKDHRTPLSAWCRAVGPGIVQVTNVPPLEIANSGLTVLTWNQHENHGDLETLLRSYMVRSPLIALVQEVARTSKDVPMEIPHTIKVPGYIGPHVNTRREITAIAANLNLSLAYLPSMPNGARTQQDRGCAILSTLPISDVTGIELPWVAQRRIAVMATVAAIRNGVPWQLRVVSMHLDNRSGRSKQAAAAVDFLERQTPKLPILIGGDLNSWSGVEDVAVREINRVVPIVPECGDQPTFSFFLLALRLDHLFTTLPRSVRSGCSVENNRFGSDHYPMVLRLFTS